jgi:hypothetical protein
MILLDLYVRAQLDNSRWNRKVPKSMRCSNCVHDIQSDKVVGEKRMDGKANIKAKFKNLSIRPPPPTPPLKPTSIYFSTPWDSFLENARVKQVSI